ncbi:deoxyribonuclease IV [Mycoplasmopsis hyopharyngis]|uniref:deoxyribonuclease IV n=1 Tax=Mycoplasmopsis hyopharyngis TaxID=29558 RepID=UPI003873C66E
MIKLGSHISFKAPNYLYDSVKESIANKANTLMVYLGAPQNTNRVSVDLYKYNEYKQAFGNIIPEQDIIVHAPYIVNPANPEKQQFAIDFLIAEIKRMNYIKAKYLVLHPGSFTKWSPQVALDTLVSTLKAILKNTQDVVICIETMAGKGSEIGINFDQLKYILNNVNDPRIQICLDTCHLWDAGYDLKQYEQFKKQLIEFDLLKNVKVIHLNDSKNELNSHKDRHANIDQGFIGLKTLQLFVHDPDFDNIPIILETPIPEQGPIYDQEIQMLLKK